MINIHKDPLIQTMIENGATQYEAEQAKCLIDEITPGLKIMEDGRIPVKDGYRTIWGFYCLIRRFVVQP